MPDGATTVIAWLAHLYGANYPDLRLWVMLDDRLRLALAQGWVLGTSGEPNDDLAEDLAADDSECAHFATMLKDLTDHWRHVYTALRGESGILHQINIVGVDMELVVLTGPEHIGPVWPGVPFPAHSFIVRFEDEEWKVAALARRLPVPGWPPREQVIPGLGIDI